MSGDHGHRVSTRKEAERIINRHKQFWISDCGCRVGRGRKCKRSRIDTCLAFSDPGPKGSSGGGGTRKVTRKFVDALLKEAADRHLICQPFDYGKAACGICFCCDDCCFLFNPKPAPYTKGKLIESTDAAACIACGKCVKVCHFGARKMKRRKLTVDRDLCSGCGLCLDVCPVTCIRMVKRA